VVLTGPKALVRLQDAQPTFYVQSSDGLGARLELISLKVGGESPRCGKGRGRPGRHWEAVEQRVAVQLERTQLTPGFTV